MLSIRQRFEHKIKTLQKAIVDEFKKMDPQLDVIVDIWERSGGGGGTSNILQNGQHIEKGGVNISVVHGVLPELMQERLNAVSSDFYASGISLVIHPKNPFAPTVHFNIRYFELYKNGIKVDAWFGGGMDLTPYYGFEEDAIHFHTILKNTCDQFESDYYRVFKQQCDDYFYNSHRDEHRGVGGVFFDYLKEDDSISLQKRFEFTTAIGDAFIPSYFPILRKRIETVFSEKNKVWQEIRRGRYVEFNLIHDRGTLFGLKTNGRTESILMSLPPTVRWVYDHSPEAESEEAELIEFLKPKDWVNHSKSTVNL